VFGLLNVNKPPGPTSHDIVAGVRRGVRERRVGHAGTLDPMAGGVLIVALGEATRLAEYLTSSDKEYVARITFGLTTDTYDLEGAEMMHRDVPRDLTQARIESVLVGFQGQIAQIPPVFSAVKVRGKSAHARARAGEAVTLLPRQVTIHQLEVIAWESPSLTLRIECSAGTYVRSLAHDLGEELGCGGTLAALTRTRSGGFVLGDAIAWNTLEVAFANGSWEEYVLPPDLALDGTPQMTLSEADLNRVAHGGPFRRDFVTKSLGRAYAPDGRFVGVLRGDPDNQQWRPVKVFRDALDCE
jgi:tRNA pseudouridine55 synthase